jgi:hypothetical protein
VESGFLNLQAKNFPRRREDLTDPERLLGAAIEDLAAQGVYDALTATEPSPEGVE